MRRNHRPLVDAAGHHTAEEVLAKAERLLEGLPGNPDYPEEEVAEFVSIANALDHFTLRETIRALREGHVRIPPVYAVDARRLLRYAMYRWREPEVRSALVAGVHLSVDRRAKGLIEGDLGLLPELYRADGIFTGDLLVFWSGQSDRLAGVVAAWPGEEQERRQAWYQYGRALMHRLLHQPPVIWQKSGFQERRRLIRRIHRRDLQLRSLRHNLYQIGRERKALVTQVWQAERAAMAEMDRLAAELKRMQQELADAEVRHSKGKAAEAARWSAAIDGAEQELALLTREFAEALSERSRWALDTPLAGLAVAVVGDDARTEGYRTFVEAAGGRFTHVSAVEKLNRIPEAVAAADLIILMTDVAKHAAEHRLRKAAGPGALVLRCPTAGLAAFDRVLRSEALPRITVRDAAASRQGGGPDGIE